MRTRDPRADDLRSAECEPGPSAWQRLCVHATPDDPVLVAIEDHLDRPEVADRLRALEDAEEYPESVLDELRRLGLMSMFAPGADGDEARVTAFHVSGLNALTSRRNTSLAVTISVNTLGLLPVYVAGTPEQRAWIDELVADGAFSSLLLSEVRHGSNLLANEARAEPGTLDADGAFRTIREDESATHYRITGEKDLINGANRHTLLFTFLRSRNFDAGAREPLAARADFTMFIVERVAGVVPLERWRTLPARGADISGVRFDGVVVPADRILGREGGGMTLAQKTLTLSRGGVASLASGCMSRARDVAVTWASRRTIYGAGEPIARLGAIADHLIRVEALDRVVAAVAMRTAALLNALGLGAAHYTGVAKSIACSLAEEGVREGQRVLGARALLLAYPYERLLRDVLLYGVFDGTNHVMLQELGHRLVLEARRTGDQDAERVEQECTIERMREVYATVPRSLYEALRGRATRVVLPLELHLRALDGLPGVAASGPLADACELLFSLVRTAEDAGRWGEDQGFRIRAAELYATLEALAATLELADPDRRVALGIGPIRGGEVALDRPIVRFAVQWLGLRVLAGIRALAIEGGFAGFRGPGPAIEAVEAALAHDHGAVRAACTSAIQSAACVRA